jgi:asparagine synthase (glutamine-hydrolysing)
MPHRCAFGAVETADAVDLGEGTATFAADPARPLRQAGLTIVADVRLDNRADLCGELGLGAGTPAKAVILAAYCRWKADCAAHLLGDFAFAIWDEARRELFCARDQSGVRPFYYVATPKEFLFASEPGALRATSVPRDALNEERIADYLAGIEPDAEATFYTDVMRLPPRTSMTVHRDGIRRSVYWSPDSKPVVRTDAPEQFRWLFEDAVRCRLGDRGEVGSMLSGGLDSSAIVCVAAPMMSETGKRLPTFSLSFNKDPNRDESRFVDSVAARYPIHSRRIAADDLHPFVDFDRLIAEQGEPFLAPGLAATRTLYRHAADAGLRVLLNGHGGDEVVSHGFGRLRELATAGRVVQLWKESRGVAALYGDSPWPFYFGQLFLHPAAVAVRRRVRSIKHAVRPGERAANPGFVVSQFADSTGLAGRISGQRRARSEAWIDERSAHSFAVTAPIQAHAFESLGRTATANGIEPRYPFWDRRLIEFCLSLPSHEKMKDGWTRSILRRGMEGVLPADVQWRRDKRDFGADFIRGLTGHRDLVHGVLKAGSELGNYADIAGARASFDRMASGSGTPTSAEAVAIWRTVILGRWLGSARAPIVVPSNRSAIVGPAQRIAVAL